MASWPYPSSTQIASPSSAAAPEALNRSSIDGDRGRNSPSPAKVDVDVVVKDDGSCDKAVARAVAVRVGGRAATGAATTTAGFPPSLPLPLPLVLVLAEGGLGVT